MKTEQAVANVRKGVGWVRLDRLGLIRVSGPHRVKFLHSLLSNDIAGIGAGRSRLAALMNLKGQQVAWLRVMVEEEAVICELPREVRDTVIETFLHYKVGAPVRFGKPDAVVFGLFGPQAGEAFRGMGVPDPPRESEAFAAGASSFGSLRVGRGRDLPADGFTAHAESSSAEALEEHLRASLGEPMTPAALETLRVEEGIPWHGIDVKEENLLHETGQLDLYHSASKGCYLGQEVVARLEGRGGNVNRRLRGFQCSPPASAGEKIFAEGREIGSLTSTGLSPEFGSIAMGYVHRSHADPGTEVERSEGTGRVVELPFLRA